MKNVIKNPWVIGAVVVIAGVALLGLSHPVKAPVASDTSEMATSTSTAATTTGALIAVAPKGPFPIDTADAITVWSFTGLYAGNAALIKQSTDDITHLTGLIGKGQYDDYDLFESIANDYATIGDGAKAYDYYNRAIRMHPKKGLGYANLGNLLNQLHAYYTAADAYAKAVAVEPSTLEYHFERLNYLTRQFPTDDARILAAIADAAANPFVDLAPLYAIKAQWLESQHRYAGAVTAWQKAKTLSSGQDTSAIDAAIARDTAKQ